MSSVLVARVWAEAKAAVRITNRKQNVRRISRLLGSHPTAGFEASQCDTFLSSRQGEGAMAKTGRNDLCPCGSGKKYKKCHELQERAGVAKGRVLMIVV